LVFLLPDHKFKASSIPPKLCTALVVHPLSHTLTSSAALILIHHAK